MTDFRRLQTWQIGRELTHDVYAVSALWPTEERFGLVSQSRRAAISICSNIAEGSSRGTRDFRRYVNIALGSANELESLLQISIDVGYGPGAELTVHMDQAAQIGRMLASLRDRLSRQLPGDRGW
jgi:four helix bundle protein